MKEYQEFTVTEDHLKLIKKMYVEYNDWSEFGAPQIDTKRPYGNSNVYRDIGKVLKITGYYDEAEEMTRYTRKEEEQMLKIHKETATALQIVLVTGSFETGTYRVEFNFKNWEKI